MPFRRLKANITLSVWTCISIFPRSWPRTLSVSVSVTVTMATTEYWWDGRDGE